MGLGSWEQRRNGAILYCRLFPFAVVWGCAILLSLIICYYYSLILLRILLLSCFFLVTATYVSITWLGFVFKYTVTDTLDVVGLRSSLVPRGG